MLGGLFLVPLAVGALVLLLVVPDARSDRVSGDVDSCGRRRTCRADRRVPLARASPSGSAALSLGSDAAPILRDLVRDSGVDYAAVFDGDGTVVAEGGRLPPGVDDPQVCPRAPRTRPATPPARSSRSGRSSSATRRARGRPWWPSGSTASC